MIFLGIDIGKTGAVSCINSHGVGSVDDIPTRLDGDRKGKKAGVEVRVPVRRVDGAELSRLIRSKASVEDVTTIVFEDVQPRPMGHKGGASHGNDIRSQGSLMRSRGVVEGVLDCLVAANPGRFIIARPIQPQAWKRHFGLLKTEKTESIDKAREVFPECVSRLDLKKHVDRADALLIAGYWRQMHIGGKR